MYKHNIALKHNTDSGFNVLLNLSRRKFWLYYSCHIYIFLVFFYYKLEIHFVNFTLPNHCLLWFNGHSQEFTLEWANLSFTRWPVLFVKFILSVPLWNLSNVLDIMEVQYKDIILRKPLATMLRTFCNGWTFSFTTGSSLTIWHWMFNIFSCNKQDTEPRKNCF